MQQLEEQVQQATITTQASQSRWRFWLGKSALAIADQGLVSGSNFALSVVLARWMTEVEYGGFAVVFAVFLLLGTAYQAVLLIPSLVLGTTSYRDQRREYLGALIRLHFLITGAAAVLLAISALVIRQIQADSHLIHPLYGLAIALPFVLMYWLTRNACYLDLSPGPAAAGSLLYSIILFSGAALLNHFGSVSAFTGFLLMMVAGFGVSVFALSRLRPVIWSKSGLSSTQVWRDSWVYGRWELATAVTLWLPSGLCYPMTAGILGVSAAGALRALQNIALPVAHAYGALLRIVQPHMSAQFDREEGRLNYRAIHHLTIGAMAGTSAYFVLVAVFRKPLMAMLYGNKFEEAVSLVPWMLLAIVFGSGTEGLAVGLRATRSPKLLFLAYLMGGLAFSVFSIPAARAIGLGGVVGSLLVANVVSVGTCALFFLRKQASSARLQQEVQV